MIRRAYLYRITVSVLEKIVIDVDVLLFKG